MLSGLHEVLVELFRERPALAATLLDDPLHVDVPRHRHVTSAPADLNGLVPTELRADAVVTFTDDADAPVLAVIVEAQLGRDDDKRWSWPAYLTTLRGRLRCPTVLLVVSPDASVARWCASPIPLGHPDAVITPLVLGPDQIPAVTDPAAAATSPELAILSALSHGGRPDGRAVLDVLPMALTSVDYHHILMYSEIIHETLPGPAWDYLGAKMGLLTSLREEDTVVGRIRLAAVAEGEARGEAKGKAEGEAHGKAEAVLTVLAARGIDVPGDARTRITACTDLDQLDTWIGRAATVMAIDQLFD